MRFSVWSSDVSSSDLRRDLPGLRFVIEKETAAADAARLRLHQRQHQHHRHFGIRRRTALLQYLAPRFGGARIGGGGDALRRGERRQGDDEQAEYSEESFYHECDLGAGDRAGIGRASGWERGCQYV